MRRGLPRFLFAVLAVCSLAGVVATDVQPGAAQTEGGVCLERDALGICVRTGNGDESGGGRNAGGYAPIGTPVCGRNSPLGPCVREPHPTEPCFRWRSATNPSSVGQWRENDNELRLCGTQRGGAAIEIEDRIVPDPRAVTLAPRGSAGNPAVTGLATELALPMGALGVGEQIERAFGDGWFGAELVTAGQSGGTLACGTTEDGEPVSVANGGFQWVVAPVELNATGTVQRVGQIDQNAIGPATATSSYAPFGGAPAVVWRLELESPGTYVLGLTTCWQGYGIEDDGAGNEVRFAPADWRFAINQFVFVTADDGTQDPIFHVRELRSEQRTGQPVA